jgi:hypothetical protein
MNQTSDSDYIRVKEVEVLEEEKSPQISHKTYDQKLSPSRTFRPFNKDARTVVNQDQEKKNEDV